ncbi:hypothetical protein BU17DRAFT_101850 [Hysterangium stoloniferum]|nr:hypothetical protein BU17DRAFT_101850 [Hysterangium stoloniferum]
MPLLSQRRRATTSTPLIIDIADTYSTGVCCYDPELLESQANSENLEIVSIGGTLSNIRKMLITRLAVLFAIALLVPTLAAAAPWPDFPPVPPTRGRIGTDIIGSPGIGGLLWWN